LTQLPKSNIFTLDFFKVVAGGYWCPDPPVAVQPSTRTQYQ
jgi:hypothetical protein